MIKLDDNLLAELGLGSLPKPEKTAFLKHMYETLEMRVGTRLAERMSEQQMSEFEQFISGNDEQGAFKWLEGNFPDYKDVVAEEFDKLKGEIRPLVPQIVSASQAQAAGTGTVGTGQPAPVEPTIVPPAPQQQHIPPQSPAGAGNNDTGFGRPPMPQADNFAHNDATQQQYAPQPGQQQYAQTPHAQQPTFATAQPSQPQPSAQSPYGPSQQPFQQQPNQPSPSSFGQNHPMQQPQTYQQPTPAAQNSFGQPPVYNNPAQQPPAFGQPAQQHPQQSAFGQPQPGFGDPQQQQPQYGQQPPFTPPQGQ